MLYHNGYRVPRGFVIMDIARKLFLETNNINEKVDRELETLHDFSEVHNVAQSIKTIFRDSRIPNEIALTLERSYNELSSNDRFPVVVRSSAAHEDLISTSFAGQHNSFLGVSSYDDFLKSVIMCWQSLYTSQSLAYFMRLGMLHNNFVFNVLVQQMVFANKAGVLMTIDPVLGDRSQVSIEASYGFGLGVVEGDVNCDIYHVDKVTFQIRNQTLANKTSAYIYKNQKVQKDTLQNSDSKQPCLNKSEIDELVVLGKNLENLFGVAQDVEWVFGTVEDDKSEKLFVLQSRPETLWNNNSGFISYPEKMIMDRITKSLRDVNTIDDKE